jgi:hypothetical protein
MRSDNTLTNMGLFIRNDFNSDMLGFWPECQKPTLCTAFPLFPAEGETLLNPLQNCAKKVAKINVQEVIPIDELQPS